MSASAQVIDAPPVVKRSKKKMIVIAAAVLVLAGAGAGGWSYWQHQKAAHDEAGGSAKENAHKAEPAPIPVFLPMESLVVNLAGRDGERLAQVGITLQLADVKTAELIKAHMPSIRSAVLLTVARHTAEELLLAEGKEALAMEIMREVGRPLGIDLDQPRSVAVPQEGASAAAPKQPVPEAPSPVQQVLFSTLIIQ